MLKIQKYLLIFSLLLLPGGCSDKTPLQPLDKTAVILTFGDSLTYGTGTGRNNAYPAVLARLINRTVINAGIPGEVSQKGLSRLPALLKKYQPALLIICHGANDILRRKDINITKQNIQQMIDLAKIKNIQVILIGVPEFSIFLTTSPIYQELAEKNNLPIEKDILATIIANNALKADHIHPNRAGYQILAEKIAALLKKHGAI